MRESQKDINNAAAIQFMVDNDFLTRSNHGEAAKTNDPCTGESGKQIGASVW